MQELTPQRARELSAETPAVLLDVREDWEYALCKIADSLHIPLGEIPARLGELDPQTPIIVLCHHGMRSRQAAQFLLAQGFRDVSNLSGGIDAWARVVDAGMATY